MPNGMQPDLSYDLFSLILLFPNAEIDTTVTVESDWDCYKPQECKICF